MSGGLPGFDPAYLFNMSAGNIGIPEPTISWSCATKAEADIFRADLEAARAQIRSRGMADGVRIEPSLPHCLPSSQAYFDATANIPMMSGSAWRERDR